MRRRSAWSGSTTSAAWRGRLCDPLNIGRVIARPFLGERPGQFARTANRKDFSMPPLPGNILARAAQGGRDIVTVGKIGDIFAHRDTGLELKGKSNDEHVDLTLRALRETGEGGLIFVNLVDFDTEYGHRRDVAGYAACLEAFDRRLPEIQGALRAPGFLRHHRRSRQRPDLARLRSYARACADHRLRRRRAGADRRAREFRRHRRDDGGASSGCRRGRRARAGCELRPRSPFGRRRPHRRRFAACRARC